MDQELTYRLGESVLDLSRGTLRKAGARVPVRSRTFKLLSYLARNAGRVVRKDELFAAVWPHAVVTEGALLRCIRDARQSVGDEEHRIIHTVPGRGYMYLPSGSLADTPEQVPDDFDLDAGAAEPKVAVMPFSLRGVDGGLKPAFDTIVQEIRGAIANSRVIVVQTPARRRPSPRTVAGVDYLVEGQVMAGEPHLNVVVTLSDARSGRRLLTQSFFLKAENVMAFHQNVARQVVSALVFNIETASWHGTAQGTTSLHMW
ncbi:winged helix-turn-helix domain-containing protein [Labrys sp. LIt4]|uniref:winged helix-turn-helix domain-containing protein n=1 Tax=Labrys sp. LIt4 TaxID=2821355 RepID=UPI001ADF5303|nr:winged helix-turn-helix domain-containing protein [Labrys sp. LIt4]MBP0581435.1 winged helix-turn-helix domain-containing protein [Labrys sp. LIt4]